MPEEQATEQTSARPEPQRAYNFKLETGISESHFTGCTGFGVSIDSIRYREGGEKQIEHRLAGAPRFHEATLHYGMTKGRELFDWLMKSVAGEVERRDCSIVMLTPAGIEAVRWNLFQAWPCEWRGAPLDAMSREVAIERLVICYEGIEIVTS
ncbi:MAG: phage tail protein [Planctomycetota bacterium]|jgi:phage tail-like protein